MQTRQKVINGIMTIAIVGLIGSNIYFLNKCRKPAHKIRIGTPAIGKHIDYSTPLKDKKDAMIIEHELINAKTIEKPAIADEVPNATIIVEDWSNGGIYALGDIWIQDEKVIFTESIWDIEYNELTGERAKEIKKIILKYTSKELNE